MARNGSIFFARVAKKQGFEGIAGIFHETAENEKEKEHATTFLTFLKGASAKSPIAIEIPTFTIGTTVENVKFAAAGEHEERTTFREHCTEGGISSDCGGLQSNWIN
jgi:rubrerythrin